MAVSTEISLYDHVELLTAIDDVPPGSRGGVLDFFENGSVAMLEILEPDLGPAERIVTAPVTQLRRVALPAPPKEAQTSRTTVL